MNPIILCKEKLNSPKKSVSAKIHKKIICVPSRVSLKTISEGEKHYISSFLSEEEIYRLFPFLPLSVQSGKPQAIIVQHLALVKLTGTPEEKRSLGLLPPIGVEEQEWVCFLGPCCRFFSQGAGALNYDAAKIIFGDLLNSDFDNLDENREFYFRTISPILKNYYSGTQTNFPRDFSVFLTPLCLLPVKGPENLKFISDFFGKDILTKEKFFACPHHFDCMQQSGKKVQNNVDKLILVYRPELRGNLSKGSKVGKKRVTDLIIPFHLQTQSYRSRQQLAASPNSFSSSESEFDFEMSYRK
jgi:hypothetical protein